MGLDSLDGMWMGFVVGDAIADVGGRPAYVCGADFFELGGWGRRGRGRARGSCAGSASLAMERLSLLGVQTLISLKERVVWVPVGVAVM